MDSITPLHRYREIKQLVQEKVLACGRKPQEVTLITVSKNRPIESIEEIYQAGERNFGENRIQEALQKIPHMPSDCQWHLIGTLQSNKIAKALPAFHLIHSVDHFSLAQKISQVSQMQGKTTSILLQVNTSGERTKQGLSSEEWSKNLDSLNLLPSIRVEGLMTIAPLTSDPTIIRRCFRQLFQLRESWKTVMRDPMAFCHLSMGMSNDYPIAIEEGATLLRIGSAIFG